MNVTTLKTLFSSAMMAVVVLQFFSPGVFAHQNLEKTYQDKWCKDRGGKMEVILFDKARVDCVTDTHAIEFDFASKWGESIGQALYYSSITKKKPGIVLIMENPVKDQKYLNRVNTVAQSHGITVWTMTPNDLQKVYCAAN